MNHVMKVFWSLKKQQKLRHMAEEHPYVLTERDKQKARQLGVYYFGTPESNARKLIEDLKRR